MSGENKYQTYEKVAFATKREGTRPWDLQSVIQKYLKKDGLVLDAGTGLSHKVIDLQKIASPNTRFVGIDINLSQLEKAQGNIKEAQALNIHLVQADNLAKSFPFPSGIFDMVTFMLAKHNSKESFRVLKPGGIVIVERVGEMEKRNIKNIFGKDEKGELRGYLSGFEEGAILGGYKKEIERDGFELLLATEGQWETFLTRKELESLLENTPFIDSYNAVKDSQFVDQVERDLSTPDGLIRTYQHRILIVAQKPLIDEKK